jgi:hypothetical protein
MNLGIFKIHLYWYDLNKKKDHGNYGDLLGPFLVSHLSKKPIVKVDAVNRKLYKWFIKPYFTVGSIIKRASSNAIVWGSGIIKSDEQIASAKFLAVRGPRTRKRLLELGYTVPEKYGDPAILLPNFHQDHITKSYAIGIIPHYLDYEDVVMYFKNEPRIKIIDLVTTDVIKTTNEILECKAIVSSSLHGVIVPQAYGIPALWLRFSERLSGDNTKFYDYFESVGITYENPLNKATNTLNFEMLSAMLEAHKNILKPKADALTLRKNDLMETCPFN